MNEEIQGHFGERYGDILPSFCPLSQLIKGRFYSPTVFLMCVRACVRACVRVCVA